MSDDLSDNAKTEYAKRLQSRLDRELIAAWRAGYSHLVVLYDSELPRPEVPVSMFRTETEFIPTNDPLPLAERAAREPCGAEAYVVEELDRETVQKVRRGEI